MTGWAGYLAAYHDANPGVTEDVLATARDGEGRTPYEWLLEAVPVSGPVVDLGCGSGPVVRLVGEHGRRLAVGVDRSAGELARARGASPGARLVRADAAALPLRGGFAGAVTTSMALMLLAPLDAVLGECARVLHPGGALVATVPTRATAGNSASHDPSVFAQILALLGQAGLAYPEPLDPACVAGRFRSAGFELLEDTTGRFVRTVSSPADADLVVRSFYAPAAHPSARARAAAELRQRVQAASTGAGLEVTYPVRRLVAVLSGS